MPTSPPHLAPLPSPAHGSNRPTTPLGTVGRAGPPLHPNWPTGPQPHLQKPSFPIPKKRSVGPARQPRSPQSRVELNSVQAPGLTDNTQAWSLEPVGVYISLTPPSVFPPKPTEFLQTPMVSLQSPNQPPFFCKLPFFSNKVTPPFLSNLPRRPAPLPCHEEQVAMTTAPSHPGPGVCLACMCMISVSRVSIRSARSLAESLKIST